MQQVWQSDVEQPVQEVQAQLPKSPQVPEHEQATGAPVSGCPARMACQKSIGNAGDTGVATALLQFPTCASPGVSARAGSAAVAKSVMASKKMIRLLMVFVPLSVVCDESSYGPLDGGFAQPCETKPQQTTRHSVYRLLPLSVTKYILIVNEDTRALAEPRAALARGARATRGGSERPGLG